jgi:hypothetical protein
MWMTQGFLQLFSARFCLQAVERKAQKGAATAQHPLTCHSPPTRVRRGLSVIAEGHYSMLVKREQLHQSMKGLQLIFLSVYLPFAHQITIPDIL